MGCIKKGRGGGGKGVEKVSSFCPRSCPPPWIFFFSFVTVFVMFAGYGDNFKFNLLFLSFFS